MKVVLVKVGKSPVVTDIPATLEAEQALVGGYIQAVYPWSAPIALVCDEEALLKRKPFNGFVGDIPVCGDFFLCGLGEEDFTDFPMEYLAEVVGQ